jgi:hypothetical protein
VSALNIAFPFAGGVLLDASCDPVTYTNSLFVSAKISPNNASEPALVGFMDTTYYSGYGMGYGSEDDTIVLSYSDPTSACGYHYIGLDSLDVSSYGTLDYDVEFDMQIQYITSGAQAGCTSIVGVAYGDTDDDSGTAMIKLGTLSFIVGLSTPLVSYPTNDAGVGDVPILSSGAVAFGCRPRDLDAANATFDDFEARSALAGDINLDGTVDAADYTIWADNYGDDGGWHSGDLNLDGVVDAADYTIWADNYGATASSDPANPANPAPEPATMSLLGVGAMILMRRRRK